MFPTADASGRRGFLILFNLFAQNGGALRSGAEILSSPMLGVKNEADSIKINIKRKNMNFLTKIRRNSGQLKPEIFWISVKKLIFNPSYPGNLFSHVLTE